MIALILATAIAAPQPPPIVDACAVATTPRDYVGRKFAIRTKLTLGRHDALLNRPSDCAAILYRVLPDSQAWRALEHISEVKIGIDYGRRFKSRPPRTYTDLEGLTVTATGTMFCPTATGRCVMQLTDLEDVVYPATFPKEMVPPGARWAGP